MKTKVLSTDLQIRNILTGSGCISFNFCKQIFGLAGVLMLLNMIAIPSATAQFTTGGYTVGDNNQNVSPGWLSGPLCPPSNITSQTFPNWESSGIDVTYSYSTNGWDGDAPNKYVAPGNQGLEGPGCDDQFTVGINDAHCATFYHGAARITNNIADVGGPAGSATGPHTFTSTYSQNVIISNFRIGSISNLGSEAAPSPEWVHVEAYDDANNKVTINLANVTVSYIDCSNIITPGGGNIITDGTGGFYGTVQNFVRQGLGLYGNIEFSIAQPVKRIVINFWRNDSSTDPLETAGRDKYGSYTIHQNMISLACTNPTATAAATQPTCSGGVAQSNGAITISGFTAGQRYQYSSGATFNSGAATPASITAIPVGGVIVNTLPNTTQQYTVRIYDAADNACFVDRVVSITAVCCNSCFFSTNWFDGIVLKFDGILGTPSGTFGPPHINLAYDAAIGPDGMLYVASSGGNKVIKFNPSTGVHLGDFVSAGSGGLATPTGLVFGPDGDLYVSGTTAIYKYDGTTGVFINKFVDNNPAGFQPFQGIEFGPDGHLYSVDNNGGYIRKYNGATGALMLTFTPGALGQLQDIIFGPDGNLYVVEQGNNIVSEWNPTTGAKISNFISSPGGGANLLTGASFGFDGNFYLAHWDPTGGISKYDGTSGAYIGEFVAVSRPKEVLFVCGACSCTNPTHNAPTTAAGTCTGGTPNNNATITVTGIANADRIGISTGATYSGTPAYAAATNIAGAMHTFTGLMHSTQYTIRLFNGADNCFTDVTIITASITCCPPPYFFCSTLGESFDLTAEAGLTGYQWYLNGNPISGANAALYNTNVAGVYTWTALDAGNCPIGGCCAITLIENCTCTNPTHNAPTTAQGTCTGGTPNNNATITVTGIANADRIGISAGATYSGTPNYAAATTISGAMHTFSSLMHNTQYTIRLFNGADNCFTDVTITTASITCVLPPMLTHDKTGPVIGTQQPNGSYNVTYTITVTNSGGGAGTYSLYDTPTFDDDIAINGTPNFTTNAPGHPANPGPVNLSSINGTSNTLATGQAIAANATHTYTLTYNVTLDLETTSGGNNVYTACGSVAPGTPVAGQGLFNQSRLDAGNDGTIDETDQVCGDLPYLVLVKTAVAPITDNGNGNYTITYILTVSNLGGAAANYTLTDTPQFDDDATITGASYTALLPPAAVTAPITLSPIPPAPSWGIGTANQAIAAGAVHTYTLTVTANVDLSAGSTGDNFFRDCVTTTTTTSMPGDAFFNSAHLQGMGTTTITRVRDVCIGPMTPPSGYSIGSTVFRDLNNNGLQDPTETGIAGVTMQIWEVVGVKDPTPGSPAGADGADILVPVGSDGTLETADDALPYVSDAAGNYFFTGLSARNYYVVIPGTAFGAGGALQMLPTSSSPAVTDTNDNREDGDDNGVQMGGSGMMVMSPVIALGPGEVEPTGASESYQGGTQDDGDLDDQGDMTVDFGFFAPVRVGDYVWIDLDGNGLQNDPHPVQGMAVSIYNAATNALVTLDADGNAYTPTQMTNALGGYLFTNLPPGNYYVMFDRGTVANANLYTFTTPNAQANTQDATDSDAVPTTGTMASTHQTGFLPSGSEDLTLDAGLLCNIQVEAGTPQTICSTRPLQLSLLGASITPASLGGVWSSSGDGIFLDGGGLPATAFGTAAMYIPGTNDIQTGMVTLTLTSNNPGALAPPSLCPPVSDTVVITVLKVDCGNFPWDGN